MKLTMEKLMGGTLDLRPVSHSDIAEFAQEHGLPYDSEATKEANVTSMIIAIGEQIEAANSDNQAAASAPTAPVEPEVVERAATTTPETAIASQVPTGYLARRKHIIDAAKANDAMPDGGIDPATLSENSPSYLKRRASKGGK